MRTRTDGHRFSISAMSSTTGCASDDRISEPGSKVILCTAVTASICATHSSGVGSPAIGSSASTYSTSILNAAVCPSFSISNRAISALAVVDPVWPVIVSSSGCTCTEPFSSIDSDSSAASIRTDHPCGSPSVMRVPMVTLSRPNRAWEKFSTVVFISSSGTRPRTCTAPSGLRVALNSGVPASAASCGSVSTACKAKISGRALDNSPITRSKSARGVPTAATRVISASENVTVPCPNALRAAMDCATASPHVRDGTPRPSGQAICPCTPAATAALMIRACASGVSAAQASKCGPRSSMMKRTVKGVITGRGAVIDSSTLTPGGAARASSDSSLRCWATLSEIASTTTRLAVTEILERGNCASARNA